MSSFTGDDDEGHMSSVSPRFFKVIVHDTLRDKKLMLPKKFTSILKQETGRDLPKQATLGLPNGTTWDMEVRVDGDGGVWLRNGFVDFAEYCCLEHGCLLLFKHRGEFQFSVRVYGSTAVEIKYPSDSPASRSASGEGNETDDDLFSDLPEEVSSSFEGGPGGDEEEEEEDSDYEYDEESSPGEFQGTSWSSHGRNETNKETAAGGSSSRHRGGEASSYSGRGRPPAPSNASIGVPPSFTATMTETYISLRQAYIPRDFSEKYMKESERVGLKVGERVWEMKLTKLGGDERKRKNTRITGGWTSFARDNNLRIGDVCFFQLFDFPAARAAATTASSSTRPLPHHCRRPLLHVTILRNPAGHHRAF